MATASTRATKFNPWIALAGINGFLAVTADSLASHVLADRVSPQAVELFKWGADYQLSHALALLGLGVLRNFAQPERVNIARYSGLGFALGILFYCGTLYWLGLFGPDSLGPFRVLTPIGGGFLLAGWGGLSYAAWTILGDIEKRQPSK